IDRKAICDSLFFGTRSPATDFAVPVIDGGGATDIPGSEVLEFDEAKAKELWEKAEEMEPFKGPFTLAYNADSPHKDWVEAVCNSLKNTLGIEATPNPFPAFGEFRQQITARTMEGAFRSGWQADYPSVYNFLGPLYSSAAADGKGSNDGDYKNPEFDELLKEGLAASDIDAANEKFHAAEAILMEDLPAIPLWYQNTMGGFSDQVSNVQYGWYTVPLYYAITKWSAELAVRREAALVPSPAVARPSLGAADARRRDLSPCSLDRRCPPCSGPSGGGYCISSPSPSAPPSSSIWSASSTRTSPMGRSRAAAPSSPQWRT